MHPVEAWHSYLLCTLSLQHTALCIAMLECVLRMLCTARVGFPAGCSAWLFKLCCPVRACTILHETVAEGVSFSAHIFFPHLGDGWLLLLLPKHAWSPASSFPTHTTSSNRGLKQPRFEAAAGWLLAKVESPRTRCCVRFDKALVRLDFIHDFVDMVLSAGGRSTP